MKMKVKLQREYVIGIVVALVIGLLFFSLSPLRGGMPLNDSSVFLSMGRAHLEGQTLFKDIFDHKGPVIFYINALGLWLVSVQFFL